MKIKTDRNGQVWVFITTSSCQRRNWSAGVKEQVNTAEESGGTGREGTTLSFQVAPTLILPLPIRTLISLGAFSISRHPCSY